MYHLRSPELLRALAAQASDPTQSRTGYTAGQLADRCVKEDGSRPSRQLIEHLLSGRRVRATPAVARSIAEALNVGVTVLWTSDSEQITPT